MSTFAFLLFCVQACLVQNVYSQCIGAAGLIDNGYGINGFRYGAGLGLGAAIAPEFVAPGIAPYGAGLAPLEALAPAGYGGSGIGEVAVAGEMPVAGTTLVAGQVPIIGAVRFAGDLPAAGTVSIAGSCGCGGGAYVF